MPKLNGFHSDLDETKKLREIEKLKKAQEIISVSPVYVRAMGKQNQNNEDFLKIVHKRRRYGSPKVQGVHKRK